MLLTRDYFAGLISSGPELQAWCDVRGTTPNKFWEYIQRHSPPADTWSVYEISFKLSRYDASKIPTACGCLACRGMAEEDAACLYATVSRATRTIAELDPSLLAEFWDLPYYVYALARMEKAARTMAELAARYCSETSEFETKTRSQLIAEASRASLRSKTHGPA
jgi:hypothetical protein